MIDLPEGRVEAVELELGRDDLARLRDRAARDELAPADERTLLRYLIYLGAAYLEAERIVEEAGSWEEAFEILHTLYGAAGGRASVLRFHYSESARGFAEEERARAAHERMAAGYEVLVERMQGEIAIREERIGNLERALR